MELQRRSPEPDSAPRGGSRTVPLEIDLNEAPPETLATTPRARRTCGTCGKEGGEGEGGGKVAVEEWECFKCVLSGGGGGGGGGSRRLLDMNAPPPREAGEGGGGGDVSAKLCLGRDVTFIGRLGAGPMTSATMQHFERGLSLSQASRRVLQIPHLNSVDIDSLQKRGLWSAHPTPLNSPLQSQSEVYLRALREYITQRRGFLSDGWSVDFFYCKNRCKTSPVYCAPDGSRFDSMDGVARHLGLLEQHSLNAENCSDSFASIQRRLCTPSGGKQSLRFSRANSSRENQNGGSAPIQDSFPLQFEDLFIFSLGRIDSRPSYHNSSQIWPVGYRSCWHDKISGSIFVSEILEGGDGGPVFRVRRYPCSTTPVPVCSTVLSRKLPNICDRVDRASTNGPSSDAMEDDEILSLRIMLKEETPPHLGEIDFGKSSTSAAGSKSAKNVPEEFVLADCIGEFSVESRSSSSVWEMAARTLLHVCHAAYKEMGKISFSCKHKVDGGMSVNDTDTVDPLSRFCSRSAPVDMSQLIQNDAEFKACADMLMKWLEQDRFGLNVEFVQELMEKLPAAQACSGYRFLSKRSEGSGSRTVQSGFLLSRRKHYELEGHGADKFSFALKRPERHSDNDSAIKKSFPLGKPFAKLPPYLVGDLLQAWEFLWRFSEIFGLEEPSSLEELENELVHPWVATRNPAEVSGSDTPHWDVTSCTGTALRKAHGSLLKAIVSEIVSKIAAYVDPYSDAGESKSRRGKRKDMESSSSKKLNFDFLQINELTWPELARRYILVILLLEGNLDSAELNSSISSKIFYCLQGDGGILCGSLTGVAGMEADALLLAEARKHVFGLVKTFEVSSTDQQKTEAISTPRLIEVNDDEVPEWAQALEPVRKLPTNVGARIRKCVYNALEKKPPEWAKEKLEYSISKEVYKGNASGPTKRAIVSLLSEVTSKSLQPKPVKKDKFEGVRTFSDLLMKQCRIVLRRAAAEDNEKVFCTLLGKTLYPYDNDDEGLMGSSSTVSRPLDFRVIDFRLAVGAYAGSHEAFLEDVCEMWNNIRSIYSDQSDLIERSEKLSQKFKDMYEKEVLLLVQKFPEDSNILCTTDEAKREMDNQLLEVMESSLPKAPWDEGICKVCGVDRDDDHVLLCDGCDSEHHTYCLNPPLMRIPDGNWYCPSCVAGRYKSQGSSCGAQVIRFKKKRNQGEFTGHLMDMLSQLAQSLGSKEYWNFNSEERTILLKFLCDETLNTSILRDHVEQCASASADLQQKLRFLCTEWKNLKNREEILGSHRKANAILQTLGESAQDGSSLLQSGDAKSTGQQLEDDESNSHMEPYHPSFLTKSTSDKTSPGKRKQKRKRPDTISQVQCQQQSKSQCQEELPDTVDNQSLWSSNSAQNGDASTVDDDISSLKHEISAIQESIAHVESELEKMSVRKDFLGTDSAGRIYWGFGRPGTCSLLVDRTMEYSRGSPKGPNYHNMQEYPQTSGLNSGWVSYHSDAEITKLVGWLSSYGETRERELKESILQWHLKASNKDNFQDDKVTPCLELPKGAGASHSAFRVTKAAIVLEKRYGPCFRPESGDTSKKQGQKGKLSSEGRPYRCECLELIWPSRNHCLSCHKSYSTSVELERHNDGNCIDLVKEDSSKGKKIISEPLTKKRPGDSRIARASKEKIKITSIKSKSQDPDCPHDFKEISSKFVTQNSLRELVRGIGLIGSNGNPSFVQRLSACLDDPTLRIVPVKETKFKSGDDSKNSEDNKAQKRIEGTKKSNYLFSSLGNVRREEGTSKVQEMLSNLSDERDYFEITKRRYTAGRGDNRCIIPESSLRQLVSREFAILTELKINLLDMDTALPEEAVRPSMSQWEKRTAWRTFVKSARSIYEMVQATIVLENMIRADYLRKEWWYWSSLTAAVKISTLSGLALRLCTLDAAIIFEKPSPTSDSIEIAGSDNKENEFTPPHLDKGKQKASPSDPMDSPKPKGRNNKRRKDLVI